MTERTTPNSTVGELQEMIDVMIAHLEEAKSMPLSANVLVDRDEFLSMLHRMRAALPDELRAARWMVREREAFVARTHGGDGAAGVQSLDRAMITGLHEHARTAGFTLDES